MYKSSSLPISEARKKIFSLVEEVQKPSRVFTLTERGHAKAVLISVEDYESWLETLEVLKDFQLIHEDVVAARKDLKDKKTISLADLEAKISKKNASHDIPSRVIKKSPKKH